MLCPKCNSSQVVVVDSRISDKTTRRRRECLDCKVRFSTLEIPVYEYKDLKGKEALLKNILEKAVR